MGLEWSQGLGFVGDFCEHEFAERAEKTGRVGGGRIIANQAGELFHDEGDEQGVAPHFGAGEAKQWIVAAGELIGGDGSHQTMHLPQTDQGGGLLDRSNGLARREDGAVGNAQETGDECGIVLQLMGDRSERYVGIAQELAELGHDSRRGREGLGDTHQVEQAIPHRVHTLVIGAIGPALKASLGRGTGASQASDEVLQILCHTGWRLDHI